MMLMTEKLFYREPTQRHFQGIIVKKTPKGVILDRTLFFPQGGYQESDRGTLSNGEKFAQIIKVTDENGEVFHELESTDIFDVGEEITGQIDWDRRLYLSLLHSAQHVISRIVFNKFRRNTVRSEFSMKGGMVVFSGDFKNEWLGEVEDEFYHVANQAYPVERIFNEAEISIKINTFDQSPCGGTHVTNTSQLMTVYLLGTDSANKLIFDGGEIGLARLKHYGQQLYAIQKTFHFPEDIVKSIEDTIDGFNEISGTLDKFKSDMFINFFKDTECIQDVKGHKVSVLIDKDLDSRIFKKVINSKIEYSSDLYVIGFGAKVTVYAPSEQLCANELCQEVFTSFPNITGGGNRKKVDMAIGDADVHDIVKRILSNLV